MKGVKTDIKEVIIVEPQVFGDNRGWFMETYSRSKMQQIGIDADFVQDNQSYSAQRGTLRGLHFQNNPMAQAKLIRCTRGAIMDVAVDIRKGSPTYKKWVSVELSADNKKMLYIPRGFAHGFVALTDDVEVQYKADNFYSPENDRSVEFDDESIGVEWNCENPILSQKDINAPLLDESDCNFTY